MSERVVLDRDDLRRTLVRIAHEIIEKNPGEPRAGRVVGIHTRGAVIAHAPARAARRAIGAESRSATSTSPSTATTRRARPPSAPVVHASHLDFDLDGRTVVLVDDVLFTGRTVRAAIDALFDYGRPQRVQLAVLADRGHRELPIRPDYVGKNLPTPATSGSTCGSRRSTASTRSRSASGAVDAAPATGRRMRHLLSIEDLDATTSSGSASAPTSFAEVGRRDIKKVPTLRGRTIVSLFYESSTRTSSSFELAAKRLSADVISVKSAGSSVDKGESLKDTIATLSAYDPEAIVIRSPDAGAAPLVAGWTEAAVVNAGDGKHEHPSQALLDVYTLLADVGSLEGKRIWIVGDVAHSRVARSCILAFAMMGAEVTVCRPADPDPARDRGARLRGRLLPRRPRRGRRRLRAADAARADERGLRPLAARVRGPLPDRRPPARPAPAAHAPRARSTAASSSRRRSSTRPQSLITEQVASGLRRPDGDPLRDPRRRRAPAAAAPTADAGGPAPTPIGAAGVSAEQRAIASLDWRGGEPGGDLLIRGARGARSARRHRRRPRHRRPRRPDRRARRAGLGERPRAPR